MNSTKKYFRKPIEANSIVVLLVDKIKINRILGSGEGPIDGGLFTNYFAFDLLDKLSKIKLSSEPTITTNHPNHIASKPWTPAPPPQLGNDHRFEVLLTTHETPVLYSQKVRSRPANGCAKTHLRPMP